MGRSFPSTMHGILVVDKPVGPSSMQAVAKVRKTAGGCKTGHGGTLDPLASGVLVCALGKATKLVEGIMDHAKIYRTVIDLSAFTATDDAEGEREEVAVDKPPSAEAIRSVLDELTGEIEQTPPIYSACKVDGKPAYKRARAGEVVKMRTKIVRIDQLVIESYDWPLLDLTIHCGRGTYIRSLARQIGTALGCGGYLTSLRRLAVGRFHVDDATALDELPQAITQDHLIPIEDLISQAAPGTQ